MRLIAAYRAQRLSQRPILRGLLRDSHKALHQERVSALIEPASVPAEPAAEGPAGPAVAARPSIAGSVFANLIDVDAAERRSAALEAAQAQDRGALLPADPAPRAPAAETPPALPDAPAAPVAGSAAEPTPTPAALAVSAVADIAADVAIGATLHTPPLGEDLLGEDKPGEDKLGEEKLGEAKIGEDKLGEEKIDGDHVAADQPVAPEDDPPLAEIGLGPGMIIRLSQLGVHTRTDLAKADAAQLRDALGEISRLIDVESWIRHARSA
jgi:hypothetical protein